MGTGSRGLNGNLAEEIPQEQRCGLATGGARTPKLGDICGCCSGIPSVLSPRGVWPAPHALFLHETLVLVKAPQKLQGAVREQCQRQLELQ